MALSKQPAFLDTTQWHGSRSFFILTFICDHHSLALRSPGASKLMLSGACVLRCAGDTDCSWDIGLGLCCLLSPHLSLLGPPFASGLNCSWEELCSERTPCFLVSVQWCSLDLWLAPARQFGMALWLQLLRKQVLKSGGPRGSYRRSLLMSSLRKSMRRASTCRTSAGVRRHVRGPELAPQ